MGRAATWMMTAAMALCLSAGGLLTGCKKARECNELIKAINDQQGMERDIKPNDPAALTKLAGRMEEAGRKIGAVDISDEQLTKYRGRYKQIADDYAKAARDAAAAKNDLGKLQQAVNMMQQIGPRETKLIKAINKYCHGG